MKELIDLLTMLTKFPFGDFVFVHFKIFKNLNFNATAVNLFKVIIIKATVLYLKIAHEQS